MVARWLENDSPSAISRCAGHPACLSAARVEQKHESHWRPPPEVHDQVHSAASETNDHSPLLPSDAHRPACQRPVKCCCFFAMVQTALRVLPRFLLYERNLLKTGMKVTAYNHHARLLLLSFTVV